MAVDVAAVLDLLARYGYLIVFGAALAEAVPLLGFLVPGQAVVILSGAVSATGKLDPFVLIGLVALAGVVGDAGTYYLGRHYGRDLIERYGERVGIRDRHLRRSDELFAKYGPFALVVMRFSFLTRAAGPMIAGITRMRQRVFWPINVLGAVAMGIAYIALGYFLGYSFEVLQQRVGRILAVALVAAVGVYVFYRVLRKFAPQFTREDRGLAYLGIGGAIAVGFLAKHVDDAGAANRVDRVEPALRGMVEPAMPALGVYDLVLSPILLGTLALAGLVLLAWRRRSPEAILVGLTIGGALLLASLLGLWLPGGLPDERTTMATAWLGVASYLAAVYGRWTGAGVATVGGFATTAALLARVGEGASPAAVVAGFLLAIAWLAICLLVLEFRLKRSLAGGSSST